VLGYTGPLYGAASALLGHGLLWYAWKVLVMPASDARMKPAKALFGYSLLYLFGIFAALLADVMLSRIGWPGI
jgi:protoheme IX farnesyltransferase